jgi:hypothetical protein
MSQHQVLALLDDCLKDASVGLAARVAALAPTSLKPTLIRTEFNFVPWKLSGVMQRTNVPNAMTRPGQWHAKLKQAGGRDALSVVQFGVEWFDADAITLQENVTITATALAQVLDGLRDYSDAHGGTVIDVLDPIDFQFGEFTGPTSSGFLATITIEERSPQ